MNFSGQKLLSLAFLFLVAVVSLLAMPGNAHGQIFVTNDANGTIGEYTTSGATVNASLISGLSGPTYIALSGSDIFVVEGGISGFVGEYTTSGATVNASLIPGLYEPGGIAVSGSNIFVVEGNSTTGYIGEFTMSGSTVNASLVTGLSEPSGIGVSGSNIFVANYGSNTIGEYTTSGSAVNTALVSGLDRPVGFTISGSDIFVGNYFNGTIDVYTTSGLPVNSFFAGSNPSGIAVSGSDVFVSSPYTEAVGEYTTTGGTVSFPLFTDSNNPYGIVVVAQGIPEPSTWAMLVTGLFLLFALGGMRRRKSAFHASLPALIFGVWLCAMPGNARAQILVPDYYDNAIQEFNFDGTPVGSGTLISGGPINKPTNIAVSGSYLYITNDFSYYNSTIAVYTTSGSLVNPALISGAQQPFGIAVSGTDIFVSGGSNGGIVQEFTTTGGTLSNPLISGLPDYPFGIAVSGTDLFVANYWSHSIGEYTTSGSLVNANFISGITNPYSIAISGSVMFVTTQSAIEEFTLSGAPIGSGTLISGLNGAYGIAVSGSDILISTPQNTVGEYTTSGGTINSALSSDLNGAFGIAVIPGSSIPEPSTWVLVATGAALAVLMSRRRIHRGAPDTEP